MVGDGSLIKIWTDRWIPHPFTFKVISPNLFFDEDLQVNTLIDRHNGIWRKELLDVLFLPRDTKLIRRIPINNLVSNILDTLIHLA